MDGFLQKQFFYMSYILEVRVALAHTQYFFMQSFLGSLLSVLNRFFLTLHFYLFHSCLNTIWLHQNGKRAGASTEYAPKTLQ